LLNRSLRRHAPTNLIPPCQYPFFFTEPAPPELYTLSLHDALPISVRPGQAHLLVPPAAENADGAGPDGDPSARAHHDEPAGHRRSEEHTSELQSLAYLVCRLLLEKKKCA